MTAADRWRLLGIGGLAVMGASIPFGSMLALWVGLALLVVAVQRDGRRR